MPADKFIVVDNEGELAEKQAVDTSAGVADGGKIIALSSGGTIDPTMLPAGIGEDVVSIKANESISAGELVNIYWTGSENVIRKADATTSGKEANGFIMTSVTSGNNANVYFNGVNNQMTGLQAGDIYFLDDSVAGAVTTTAPTVSGSIVQRVGVALSATELIFEVSQPIKRA